MNLEGSNMPERWRGKGGGLIIGLQVEGPITGARGGGAYQWGGVKAAVYGMRNNYWVRFL